MKLFRVDGRWRKYIFSRVFNLKNMEYAPNNDDFIKVSPYVNGNNLLIYTGTGTKANCLHFDD